MIKKGILPTGIEVDGTLYREYELREQLVADEVEVAEGEDRERANKNDAYFNICIMAKRLRLTGAGAPVVTPAMVMGMAVTDFSHIMQSGKEQKVERASFRGAAAAAADAGTGTPQVGV